MNSQWLRAFEYYKSSMQQAPRARANKIYIQTLSVLSNLTGSEIKL